MTALESSSSKANSCVWSRRPDHRPSPGFAWHASWTKLPNHPKLVHSQHTAVSAGSHSQGRRPPHPTWAASSYACLRSSPRQLNSEAPLSEAWAPAFSPLGLSAFLLPTFPLALSQNPPPRSLKRQEEPFSPGSSGLIASPVGAAPLPDAVPWMRVER